MARENSVATNSSSVMPARISDARLAKAQMPQGISITEIPLAERNPEIVERFRPAPVGGGTPIWSISYHESRFEDH